MTEFKKRTLDGITPNEFLRKIDAGTEAIDAALVGALPPRTHYALFLTDESGEQATMLANIPRERVLAMVALWVQRAFEDGVLDLDEVLGLPGKRSH